MSEEQIHSLSKILKGEYMGIDAYQHYLNKLHDREIRENLGRHQLDLRKMATELESYLREQGASPPEGVGLQGLMADAQIWVQLMGDPDDRKVLDAVFNGIKMGVDQTEQELMALSGEARDIAMKHLQKNKDFLEEVVRYRNRLH